MLLCHNGSLFWNADKTDAFYYANTVYFALNFVIWLIWSTIIYIACLAVELSWPTGVCYPLWCDEMLILKSRFKTPWLQMCKSTVRFKVAEMTLAEYLSK